MWKRERMMVDVISLQNKSTQDFLSSTSTNTSNILLQNRTCGYPFGGGKIHDDKNNFFAGNEYNVYGTLTTSTCCHGNNNNQKRKRSLPLASSTTTKRQKQQETTIQQQQQQQQKCTTTTNYNYTFTSKPYDYMDSQMYYY